MLRAQPIVVPPKPSFDVVSEVTSRAILDISPREFGIMGTAFFENSNASLLNQDIVGMVSEQRNIIIFKKLCLTGRLTPTFEDAQYFTMSQQTLKYQLLCLKSTTTPLQKAVLLAWFMFAYALIIRFGPTSAFACSLVEQLQDAVTQTNLACGWPNSCDLLLWVLFVGVHCSRGQGQYSWFTVRFAQTKDQFYDMYSIEDLQKLLSRFFFVEEIFGPTLIAVLQESRAWDKSDELSYPSKPSFAPLEIGGG